MSGDLLPAPIGQGLDVDLRACGREMGPGVICGGPATVWALFDTDYWAESQASACADHAGELLDRDGVLVSSDAPIEFDEDPR